MKTERGNGDTTTKWGRKRKKEIEFALQQHTSYPCDSQYSAAALHAAFCSGLAGCQPGGPRWVRRPIDIAEALITPILFSLKNSKSFKQRNDVTEIAANQKVSITRVAVGPPRGNWRGCYGGVDPPPPLPYQRLQASSPKKKKQRFRALCVLLLRRNRSSNSGNRSTSCRSSLQLPTTCIMHVFNGGTVRYVSLELIVWFGQLERR